MTSLLPLAEVIAQHQLATKKSLGQHFLLDTDLLARIARAAGDLSRQHVIEIGPGPGGLTRALLATNAAHVTAIEKDARCIAALAPLKEMYPDRFTLLDADAMELNIMELSVAAGRCSSSPHRGEAGRGADSSSSLCGSPHLIPACAGTPPMGEGIPRAIVANLPYNVGTALMVQWLEAAATHGRNALTSFTVMLQKEVAERLVAQPGSKDYGRLSVLARLLCDAEMMFDVPPEAFHPPPKVMSSIVRAEILPNPRIIVDLPTLEKVTAAAFGNRRKMLRQSLKSMNVEALAWCARAGIDPTLRAEQCSLEMFAALANAA